jgi:hypothetical protein
LKKKHIRMGYFFVTLLGLLPTKVHVATALHIRINLVYKRVKLMIQNIRSLQNV